MFFCNKKQHTYSNKRQSEIEMCLFKLTFGEINVAFEVVNVEAPEEAGDEVD